MQGGVLHRVLGEVGLEVAAAEVPMVEPEAASCRRQQHCQQLGQQLWALLINQKSSNSFISAYILREIGEKSL